jgi:hypothetical protein
MYYEVRLMDCTMIPIYRAFTFIIVSNLQQYYKFRLYMIYTEKAFVDIINNHRNYSVETMRNCAMDLHKD